MNDHIFQDGSRYKDHTGRTFRAIREDDYYDDGQAAIWADYDDGGREGPFPASQFGGEDGGEVRKLES